MLLWSSVAAFAVTLALLLLMLRRNLFGGVMDHPNARSLHAAPVPRTGGLALMAGIFAAWAPDCQAWLLPLAGCVLFLQLLSLADDVRGLGVGVRLAAHIAAAGAFAVYGLSPHAGWMLAAAVIAMVWMTNLYNFMDGSDGLAGGMALFGFGSYALAAWLSGNQELAVASACIAAAAAAFLCFNFYPARVFLGDAGSIPLGFAAAAVGLLGWRQGNWPVWFPLLVFSPFIVDATLTLLQRLLRAEKIWQAHHSHYYQRLVRMGLGHRNTAFCEYGLMLAAGGSALWLAFQPPMLQMTGLGIWCIIYALIAQWIDKAWRRHERSQLQD